MRTLPHIPGRIYNQSSAPIDAPIGSFWIEGNTCKLQTDIDTWTMIPILIPKIKKLLLSGAVAGNFTVSGIKATNILILVLHFVYTTVPIMGTGVILNVNDITSEFTITSDNTINNTGGTNTTGNKFLVIWTDLTL